MTRLAGISGRMSCPAALLITCILAGCGGAPHTDAPEAEAVSADAGLTVKERLGRLLFFDESLSSPPGQSCATCHDPAIAFADPEKELPVSKGAVHGLYGSRNDMTASYAAFVPPLAYDEEEEVWAGGLFWDGRVDTLAEQAKLPPVTPFEMANPDAAAVVEKLRALPYAGLFDEVYGPGSLDDAEAAFDRMADAMEAFQKTSEVNPFGSKYDRWLRGEAELSEQELRGLALFEAEDKGNCAACHPSRPGEDGSPPLFTDFTYDNLGTPRNPENPFYGMPPEINPDGFGFVDAGLAATVGDPAERGKFRVPTLRNVAVTAPYMHNGVFKTLFTAVAFYNTRDVAGWPPPEVSENVNTEELGDLGLTAPEIEDIVAFLGTLTDGWEPGEGGERGRP